jgi:uncharacterized protein (TIGR02186 family)
MKRCAKGCLGILLLLGCAVIVAPLGAQGAAPDLLVVPDRVEIGAFYRGSQVLVSGTIPAGAEAVVEVIGRETTEKLLRKGRRGGLWMNVGELEVRGAPSLYLVMSTSNGLLSEATRDAAWGYPALTRKMELAGSATEQEQAQFRDQFIKLKESQDLFGVFPGGLTVSSGSGGKRTVKGVFTLPTKIKPDTYRVRLSVVEQGKVVAVDPGELTVVMAGFPAMLKDLAHNHALLYGVLAVVIAIVTGFSMGYLFKKGGGGH